MVQRRAVRAGISPKDLAEAIGVSESSVKRWVDQGTLRAARTAGGHRRIAREEALRFIREQHNILVRPDKLGLEPAALMSDRDGSFRTVSDQLYNHLIAGQGQAVRSLLVGLQLAGHDIATIADHIIRPTFDRLGRLWKDNLTGIFLEHRATQLCLVALDELRTLASQQPIQAGRCALIAGPPGDPYLLPLMLATLTLREAGWQVTCLGPDTPLDVIDHAARDLSATLICLSVTASPRPTLADEIGALVERVTPLRRRVLVGGQAVCALTFGTSAPMIGHSMADLLALTA